MKTQVSAMLCFSILMVIAGCSANSFSSMGYSALTLDTPAKDEYQGFEIRGHIPLNQVYGTGLQNFAYLSYATYGGNSLPPDEDPVGSPMALTLGYELGLKMAFTDSCYLIPSVCGGGTMWLYDTAHRIYPSVIYEREDETAFGFMGKAGAALILDKIGIEVSYGLHEVELTEEADGLHNQLYAGLVLRF